MLKNFFQKYNRYFIIFGFYFWFIATSFLLRIILIVWQSDEVSLSFSSLIKTFLVGFLFDTGTANYILYLGILYLTFFPDKFRGTLFDKIVVYFFSILTLFILVFTFFAEITFWEEFRNRFNFIAVDYLIYTHEVVKNIEQSYPLYILVPSIAILTFLFVYLFHKWNFYKSTFTQASTLKQKLMVGGTSTLLIYLFTSFVTNTHAEWSTNRYNSEISKAGIYSFFSAFRNNQMLYPDFYTSLSDKDAFGIIRNKLQEPNSIFISDSLSLKRNILSPTLNDELANKNVVLVLMESMSASFMNTFGSTYNITPVMDSLSNQSLFFSNLYATGTRTVRGMEAMTLSIPPTPGQSIVKRPENHNLYTVASVFKARNYTCNFFYGGDGYFDNMNSFFGGNGFHIYDRGRGSVLSDEIKTTRNNINDDEVSFENAWGICDEDIYHKMIKAADLSYHKKERFFNFVMTTSNHRPYTYPENKIDIPSGTGREGAVKYADYALGQLIKIASTKPWFKNTVFVIVADHCASSAGKDAIDVANYHIPALIVNFPKKYHQKVDKLCSQIDIMPTLFEMMGWNYQSNFFGKNILNPNFEQRTFVATYRKLSLMKENQIMVLSDQKKQDFYRWNKQNNSLTELPMNQSFLKETIAWYQTADYLFTHKLLK
jgi:phosphoglycerol transferase MdoB-like AlkP superfamily enzyme